jgi:hypothetical protein
VWSGPGVDDLLAGDGHVGGAQAEEGLERGQGCASSVVTEDELVEVGLGVLA